MTNMSAPNVTYGIVKEPRISTVFRLTLYAIVFVVTVIGNVLVIMVIMKNRKLRSLETYYYGYYLMNLAIADLSVALLGIPFTVIYTETSEWPYGVFMCKFVPTLIVTMLTASALTLLVLTFERYWAIVYPFKPRLTRNKLLFILSLVWFFSFTAAAPELVVYKLSPTDRSDAKIQDMYPCREHWPTNAHRQGYTVFLFLFGYFVPLILILLAYLRIVYELSTNKTECFGSVNEKDHVKKTIRVLIVVVASFALCFAPEKFLFLWIDYGKGGKYKYIDILIKYSYFFGWFNSCINPIIYGAVDINFRNFYATVIKQCSGCKSYSSKLSRRISTAAKHSTHSSHKHGEYELTANTCDTKMFTGNGEAHAEGEIQPV